MNSFLVIISVEVVFSCFILNILSTQATTILPSDVTGAAPYKPYTYPTWETTEDDVDEPLPGPDYALNSPSVFYAHQRPAPAKLGPSIPITSIDPVQNTIPTDTPSSSPPSNPTSIFRENKNIDNRIFTDASFLPVFVASTDGLTLFMQNLLKSITTPSVFG